MASVRSILAAVVATVASAALLAGCTTTRTIDSPRLEQQVRSYAVRLGNRPASARCPDRIPVMKGYTFECTVTEPSGAVHTVKITERDDQGNLELQFLR